jgi:hypothetical protein
MIVYYLDLYLKWCSLFSQPCFNYFSQPQSFFVPTRLWRWNRQSVPKRWHIKFRRREITQKKAYNIQNTKKSWNYPEESIQHSEHGEIMKLPRRKHTTFRTRRNQEITQKKAYNIQNTEKSWNYPEESIQHSEHGEIIKLPRRKHTTFRTWRNHEITQKKAYNIQNTEKSRTVFCFGTEKFNTWSSITLWFSWLGIWTTW